jgi:methylenetetrahydrofolate reductase (NADPH)
MPATRPPESTTATTAEAHGPLPSALTAALTERERQVLALRAAGEPVAAIATRLVVEPRTVKFHLRNVYAKLCLADAPRAARQVALARYASGAADTRTLAPATAGAGGAGDTPSPAGPAGAYPAHSTLLEPDRPFLFRPDRTLTEVLARGQQGQFTLSAEVIPPRNGAEQAAVLAQVARLIEAGAQFLAVTKGAGGSLRGGSLPIALAIKERFGVPCIAHFTCRDLTPEEVENQLIDHHYFGIRNILALRGDPPDGQPDWQARPGGYEYAHQLIEQIRMLNRGVYLPRPGGPPPEAQAATDFCIGAAVYPEHPDPGQGIDFFKRKVDAGAEYAITQMVFDADAYGRFLDRCGRAGLTLPVLPGTRILGSRVRALRTADKYGVSVPDATLRALPLRADLDTTAAKTRALDVFLALVERLRRLGAPGVHLFVTDVDVACDALSTLAVAS